VQQLPAPPRILRAGESHILSLEEEEWRFLKEAVYPPQSRWLNHGVLVFQALRAKLDEAPRE